MGKGEAREGVVGVGLGVKREHFLKDRVIPSCLFAHRDDLVEAQIPIE